MGAGPRYKRHRYGSEVGETEQDAGEQDLVHLRVVVTAGENLGRRTGTLKGVGCVYQQTFIDTYAENRHCQQYLDTANGLRRCSIETVETVGSRASSTVAAMSRTDAVPATSGG